MRRRVEIHTVHSSFERLSDMNLVWRQVKQTIRKLVSGINGPHARAGSYVEYILRLTVSAWPEMDKIGGPYFGIRDRRSEEHVRLVAFEKQEKEVPGVHCLELLVIGRTPAEYLGMSPRS